MPTLTRRQWLRYSTFTATALPTLGNLGMATASDHSPIVDSHVHVWKNDPRFPWAAELTDPPKEDAGPSTLLSLMRANGVAKTVIVHVIYYRWDCRYTAAAIQATPGRFMGVCRIDPQSPTPTADLDHWIEQGFHGVRLSPPAGPEGDWIRDQQQMDRIAACATQRRIPLCVLCPISRIPDVERLVQRHRDSLDVCIDHMADCPIDQPAAIAPLLALGRYPRVFVKISHPWSLSKQAYPYRDTHDQIHRVYDAFGPRRLMWGTDWPMVEQYCGYARALALYRDEIKFFTDDDRRWILGKTALRLWPFPEPG